jgi:hypothetical protein
MRSTYLPLEMKRSIANPLARSTPGFTGFVAAKLARKRSPGAAWGTTRRWEWIASEPVTDEGGDGSAHVSGSDGAEAQRPGVVELLSQLVANVFGGE